MYYVYLLRSIKNSSETYIGYTNDLQERIKAHNSGRSPYTDKDKQWKLVTYVAFDCKDKAVSFEKYIKVGSGYAFAKRRLW